MCAICCKPNEDPENDPFVCMECLHAITLTEPLEENVVANDASHRSVVGSRPSTAVAARARPARGGRPARPAMRGTGVGGSVSERELEGLASLAAASGLGRW